MTSSEIDPLSRLALLVFRAQQALSLDGDRITARWGLTSAKWKVLGAVALAGRDLSAAAIGRAMGMTRQAAIKQIHLLLEQGMLRQRSDPQDARAPLHALTARGKAAYAAISQAWTERGQALTTGLRQTDLERTCQVLAQLLAQLEQVPDRSPPRKESRK